MHYVLLMKLSRILIGFPLNKKIRKERYAFFLMGNKSFFDNYSLVTCIITSKTIRGCLLVGELEALVTS